MNDNIIEKAVAHWKKEGVSMNPSASETAIAQVEQLTGFMFPDSFKSLYKIMNGFPDGDMGACLVSMWPLERIVEEYNTVKNKDLVCFADFLINSHTYGFKRNDSGICKDYGEKYEIQLAAVSFEAFIELILREDGLLY